MTTSSLSPSRKHSTTLLFIIIIAVACYVILPQLKYFHTSLHSLGSARLGDVLVAVIVSFITSVLAAVTYQLLALKPLRYGHTVLVQFASLFTNHLLPAGIGGIGISYRYLRKTHHTTEQASLIVLLNNLIGLLGHLILLLLVVLLFHVTWPKFHTVHVSAMTWLLVVGLVAAALIVLSTKGAWRQKASSFGKRLFSALHLYRSRSYRLVGSLGSSMLLTLTNISCLFYCAHAVGLTLGVSQCFVVFTAGILVGTAAPTPGGLGGFEAGLLAGMLSYHVASGPALAAVLLFRLITYWLALVLGALSFGVASKLRVI